MTPWRKHGAVALATSKPRRLNSSTPLNKLIMRSLAFWGGLLLLAANGGLEEEFGQLWEMVVVGRMSRGVRLEHEQEQSLVQHVCQYGISDTTVDLVRMMLSRASPAIVQVEFIDWDSATDVAISMLSQLKSDFGNRVRRDAGKQQCDLVLFSDAAPRFSIERAMPRLGTNAVFAWVSKDCVAEQGEHASPACNVLNTMWQRSALMKRGYCSPSVCMALVPTEILQDPNVVSIDCPSFLSVDGSSAAMGEFGQDWYLFWNFIRGGSNSGGIYVDVGASLPFDYSNTVIFDRCLGWRGVCVEPNPHLAAFLNAYRGCSVYQNCVSEDAIESKAFADHQGNIEFKADCLPIGEILRREGLMGQRIDVLSIDVEYGELSVLKGLDFAKFDIRFIVIEVSPGARWLEVDTLILQQGYAKVAVLGRDVVFAKHSQLFAQRPDEGSDAGQAMVLPSSWEEFHQRVVDEEMEEEMRRERRAFYAGLRRR